MFNLVVLTGRLTADPELRYTANNTPVTSFSIAVSRRYKAGEQAEADFINIVAWRQTAEFVSKYFTKGQRIGVEGSLRMNRFTDRDGNNRTSYEVVVNNAHFVESKRDNANGENVPSETENATQSENTGDFVEVSGDDDLPF